MPNPSHPYTLASRTSPSASQNLPKSMAAQPHRQTADIKHGHTTSCIVHLAYSANLKAITSNKRCGVLTGLCFESPNDTIHVTVNNHKNDIRKLMILVFIAISISAFHSTPPKALPLKVAEYNSPILISISLLVGLLSCCIAPPLSG